ncbi:MAG: ImmA/IrrE family metallo-endopeptidase [Chloroflexota bacterium]|nr:MAG: ImmA/IrrE family metallo-endopeptidase [Chloroflexota bacterium]
MTRVRVKPELLRWARDRSRVDGERLAARFPSFEAWERGDKQPTLKQVEAFAKVTHTPVGYLFLPAPPVERVPIPDLRTRKNRPIDTPSPDLLDTLYQCQQRQSWYREFAQWVGEAPRDFVGSVLPSDDVTRTATQMRSVLQLDLEARRQCSTWTEALRKLIEQADSVGVLVMVNGVVGNDNHRKLDPDEFRGFALADTLAPLVFVNGADTKAAQMFTLVHELVHVWIGETALSNLDMATDSTNEIERFCDRVAAELLVPLAVIADEFDTRFALQAEVDRLARRFKVSTLVILRRLFDATKLSRDAYWAAYGSELKRLGAKSNDGGGNFYLTLGARAGKRFARAVVVSALEGRSSFTEAFRLLGFRKMSTFDELGRSLGVVA